MIQPFHIRPSGKEDLAAIDGLLARSYPALLKADYPPSVLVLALPLISRANPNLVTCGTYFVAETDDGAIIAAGGWTREGPQAHAGLAGTGHIRHVVTDHTRTRQGVGRALMTRVLETARDAGLRHLKCQSTLTAVPFYEACGFQVVGEITISLRPGIDFPAIAMQRSI